MKKETDTMGVRSKPKRRTLKKQTIEPDQLTKKRKVIGGFTEKARKAELKRQKFA